MISVVMPAYNSSKFIAPAIESIQNQTFKEFELVIVDDGSTDNTVKIVKDYLKVDKRVRLIQNQHHGICDALNTGIQESKYPWIARMDADDIALPQRFEKQINAAHAQPQVVVWGSYVNFINSTGKVLSLLRQGATNEAEFYDLLQNGVVPFVVHPTFLLKKETLLKVGGYNPKLKFAQDVDLLSRIAEYGPILAIPEPLLLYRVYSQNYSMEKFFSQHIFTKWIYTCHKARLAGVQQPELEQFLEEEKTKPVLSRLNRNVRTLGQFWYKKAGLFAAENQYLQASLYLSMAIAAHPSYSLPRIWKKKLSPQARRCLQNSPKL